MAKRAKLAHDRLLTIFLALAVTDVVSYIVENCPAEGDCNKCPTKDKCRAHNLEAAGADIEDLEKSLCGIHK